MEPAYGLHEYRPRLQALLCGADGRPRVLTPSPPDPSVAAATEGRT